MNFYLLLVKQLFCAAETEMMVQLRGDAVCLQDCFISIISE